MWAGSRNSDNPDHRLYSSDKVAYLSGTGALNDSVASVGKSGDQERLIVLCWRNRSPLDASWLSV